MDYVLGMDVYFANSPDDKVNARKGGVDDAVIDNLIKSGADWNEVVDPAKAAANWKATYDAGVRFVYIKATEYVADPGFSRRMQYAKAAGMLRGAYILPHFERDNIAEQADLFIKTVGSDQGELPPALDLESPGGNWPKGAPLFKKIKLLLDRMEQAFERKPIIYTSQSIVRDYLITNPPWGKDYDVWVASYPYFDLAKKLQYSDPSNPLPMWSSTYPPQPDGYKPWVIWQWTEKGRINGLGQENVDLNKFKGTFDQLLAWANAKAPTPTPIPPQPVPDPVHPPTPQPQPQPDPNQGQGGFVTYTVKPGDSLGILAENYHTTIEAIMALNPQIKNRNIIVDGWVLKIPTS